MASLTSSSVYSSSFLIRSTAAFPAFVLVDGQAFERLNRGFGRALCLQVALENGDVVIDPLQALAPNDVNALQHLAGVNQRLGVRERVGGSGIWQRFAANWDIWRHFLYTSSTRISVHLSFSITY